MQPSTRGENRRANDRRTRLGYSTGTFCSAGYEQVWRNVTARAVWDDIWVCCGQVLTIGTLDYSQLMNIATIWTAHTDLVSLCRFSHGEIPKEAEFQIPEAASLMIRRSLADTMSLMGA